MDHEKVDDKIMLSIKQSISDLKKAGIPAQKVNACVNIYVGGNA